MSRTITIRHVFIRNILSHEQSDIEFHPGLTAIVGPNGAGKSTIVDSIVYALFVKRAALRGSSKKDLLRHGCSEGEIRVLLDVGGKQYLVRRVVRSSGSDEAQLYEVLDDEKKKMKLIATGVENVVNEVLKLFGVPSPDAVRYTMIARQDELTKILDARPAERKEMILKLLGLEDLEKAREVLKPYIRRFREALGELNMLRQEIVRLENELKKIDRELEHLGKEIDRLSEEESSLREEVAKIERSRDMVLELEKLRELVKKIEELEKIENELAQVKEALQFVNAIQSIDVGALRTRMKDYRDLKRRFEELKKRFEDIEREQRSIVSKLGLDSDENIVEAVRRLVEMRRFEMGRMEAELRIYREALKVIRDSATCPVCGSPLTDEHRLRVEEELREKVKRLEEAMSRSVRELRELEEYLRRLEKLEYAKNETQALLDNVAEQLDEVRQVLKPMLSRAQELCSELSKVKVFESCFRNESCVEALACVQRMVEKIVGRVTALEERRRKLYEELGGVSRDSVLERVEILEGSLRALGIDPRTSYAELDRRYRELMEKLRIVEQQRAAAMQRVKDLETRRSEIFERINKIREDVKRLEKYAQVLPVLEKLHDEVLGRDGLLARELTKLARSVIERYANNILRSLGLGLSIRISEEFDISVKSSVGDLNVKSVSGGERTAIATALRMALAYAVLGRAPGFFILDEPTAHLDAERRTVLFDLIKKISESLPQVIVVTHDMEVVDRADHVLEVVKEGTKSVVRYVSKQL